jgi:DNA-binding transcriptional ArsR family regulator
MEEPVTIIDRDVLKVISVDTRMDILKILAEGERNPSFLSKTLHKSDATIIEHLEVLQGAGLVKKIETPGKKWVFYTLTERGKGIISSKSRRLIIILGISLLALGGGILNLFTSSRYTSQLTQTFGERAAAPAAQNLSTVAQTSVTANQTQPLLLSILLFTVFFIGMAYYLRKKRYF